MVAGKARKVSSWSHRSGGCGSGSLVGSTVEPLLADPVVLLVLARGIVPQPRVQHHDAVLAPLSVIGLPQVPVAAAVWRGCCWGLG